MDRPRRVVVQPLRRSGSIDVVAWHPTQHALAIMEVKTRLADLQDLLAKHDRKVRVARRLLPKEQGWRPTFVGRIVVMADGSGTGAAVHRHGAVLDTVLPARSVAIKQWFRRPDTNIAGIWFLRFTGESGAVRPRRSRLAVARA
jgi:hypothetical protein